MAQEYQQPVDSSTPSRTQRMTAAESRAVIDLWQQEQIEQTGLTDKPALPDVAEGLDITVEDVQRLLAEVRARRLEEERTLARDKAELRLAEEWRKLAEVQRQKAEVQVAPVGPLAPRSRWVEVRPGVWEDAELAAIEANQPVAIKFVKALFKVIILSLFLIAPFALLIYGIIVALNLR